jgi:hypothetical protein
MEGVNNTFSSWEGRMRVLQRNLAEAEATNRKWSEWYDYQETKGDKSSAEPEEPPKEPWERVDWDRVEEVAASKGNSEAWKLATKMAFEEMKKDLAGDVKAVKEEVGQPVAEMKAEREYKAWAENLWFTTVESIDNEGNFLYPELNEKGDNFDPEASKMIVSEWLRLRKTNPDFANSPHGIDQAVTNFRYWALQSGYKSPSEKTADVNQAKDVARSVARNKLGQFTKTTKARNEAASGGSSTPTPTGDVNKGPSQSMSEAAQRKRIRDAGRTNLTEQDRSARNIFGVL